MGTYCCCPYSGEFKTKKMWVRIFMLVCFATVCFSISLENIQSDQIDLEDYEDGFSLDFENEDNESMMSDDLRVPKCKDTLHPRNYCKDYKKTCWKLQTKLKCPKTCKACSGLSHHY